jgi:SRSO17 transposase
MLNQRQFQVERDSMKETTPSAMPPCFDRWCKRFDDLLSHQAQKREFRNYIGGLLGESERKNLSQMAANAVGVKYHRLHHFLTEAPGVCERHQRPSPPGDEPVQSCLGLPEDLL